MKKILLIMALFAFIACERNIVINQEEEKTIPVVLSISPDVFTEDEPLTRVQMSTDDLLAIQIDDENGHHAYGLFDNDNNLVAYLKSGHTYSMSATMIIKGKSLDPNFPGNYYPFRRKTKSGYGTYGIDDINQFFYQSDVYFDNLLAKTASTTYKEVERLYGTLNNYLPEENGTATINLKPLSFGIRYTVKGITDGSIRVKIYNTNKTFVDQSGISTDYESTDSYFECYSLTDAWQYHSSYTEAVKLNIIWSRGIGIDQDLGTKDIQLKVGEITTFRINLGADDGGASFGITTEDAAMTSEEVTYTFN